MPSGNKFVALAHRHPRFKQSRALRCHNWSIGIAPDPGTNSRQHSSAEGCGLDHSRPPHWALEQISLELHQVTVGGCASIDPEFRDWTAGISAKRRNDIADLIGNTIKRGAHYIGFVCIGRYADYGAARPTIPIRRA